MAVVTEVTVAAVTAAAVAVEIEIEAETGAGTGAGTIVTVTVEIEAEIGAGTRIATEMPPFQEATSPKTSPQQTLRECVGTSTPVTCSRSVVRASSSTPLSPRAPRVSPFLRKISRNSNGTSRSSTRRLSLERGTTLVTRILIWVLQQARVAATVLQRTAVAF